MGQAVGQGEVEKALPKSPDTGQDIPLAAAEPIGSVDVDRWTSGNGPRGRDRVDRPRHLDRRMAVGTAHRRSAKIECGGRLAPRLSAES